MNYIRVYVQPFDNLLQYTGEFIDVTADVDITKLGNISQEIDGNTYDVGVFKYGDFSFTLNNQAGTYSEPGVLQSIFINKRMDAIVKVTWRNSDLGAICGCAIAGESVLGEEENVFYGLLNDIASTQNIDDNKIKFSVQGLEAVFSRVETNFADLTPSDTISDLLFDLLNQSGITDLMTVDALNISVGIDQVTDSLASLEETTVKEALDQLLEMSNSILYIDISTLEVMVKPRIAEAEVSKTFYGQASNLGSEDIVNIKGITTGINKTFNFMKWSDTTIVAKDQGSINVYGARKKEISSDLFTLEAKRTAVLNSYRDEFFVPKQEMSLFSILSYDTFGLFFMSRINIDYPTVLFPAEEGGTLPQYGIAKYSSTDLYPVGTWTLTLDPTTHFKVMGRKLRLKDGIVEYKIREV